jgi:hypothetical protein
MTDHCSSSLWTDEPAHHMVSLDGLPLTEQTKADLLAWSEMEVAALDAELFDGPPVDHARYAAEGQRLWRVARDELGEAYEVGFAYFDPHPEDEWRSIKRIEWHLPDK